MQTTDEKQLSDKAQTLIQRIVDITPLYDPKHDDALVSEMHALEHHVELLQGGLLTARGIALVRLPIAASKVWIDDFLTNLTEE